MKSQIRICILLKFDQLQTFIYLSVYFSHHLSLGSTLSPTLLNIHSFNHDPHTQHTHVFFFWAYVCTAMKIYVCWMMRNSKLYIDLKTLDNILKTDYNNSEHWEKENKLCCKIHIVYGKGMFFFRENKCT